MAAAEDHAPEFRESTRAPVVAQVVLQLDAFSEPRSGYTGNVSMGGMFVRVPDPSPVGTIVKFELRLEDPVGTVSGTAEVAWIRAATGGELAPRGMGLQFRFVKNDGLSKLRRAVIQALAELDDEVEATRADPSPAKPDDCSDGPVHVESSQPYPQQSRQMAQPRPREPRARPAKTAQKPSPRSPSPAGHKDPAGLRKLIILLALLAILVLVLTRVLG